MNTIVIWANSAFIANLMIHLPAELCVAPNPPRTLRAGDAALVLSMLREGRSCREIATRIGVNVQAVKSGLAQLYREIGVRRGEPVRHAIPYSGPERRSAAA
ncbi:MAG: hypothetical protein H7251_18980 [Acetobacteraceae bacterium]|nr:hypothetical protein [Acetobacteraceae bacterium]